MLTTMGLHTDQNGIVYWAIWGKYIYVHAEQNIRNLCNIAS